MHGEKYEATNSKVAPHNCLIMTRIQGRITFRIAV